MRITALIASGRKDGNTARVVALVLERLARLVEQTGDRPELEIVFLSEIHLEPCRGCRLCFDRGETSCPIRDDLLPLKAKLEGSDALIAASPVYVDDVSGTMKTWIDRMAHLCHRPGFGGKPVLLLATTGTSPTLRTLSTMRLAFGTWGAHVVSAAGFRGGALTPQRELASRHAARLDRAARRLFEAARGALPLRPGFRDLLTFTIQQESWRGAPKESLDFAYWSERGWLDRHCTFYVPHKAPWLKVRTARVAGRVIVRFFA